MRLDHWVKNATMLPGVVVALTAAPDQVSLALLPRLLLALLATGLTSSANYVLNEVLDAPSDRHHPDKRHRPVAEGRVDVRLAWLQWLALVAAGAAVGALLSWPFAATMLALAAMGCVYNVPPVRAKDVPWVDVLAEAANNPVRMLAGWFAVAPAAAVIPVSLLASYWMAGAYFMAIKRFAELRAIGDMAVATRYRPAFAAYTEPRLLVSIMFYASAAMLFLGAFIMRYRLELVLSFPFVALVMAGYLALAFRPDSPVQAPETLYREPLVVVPVVACAMVMGVLLFVDVPLMSRVFTPTMPTAGR